MPAPGKSRWSRLLGGNCIHRSSKSPMTQHSMPPRPVGGDTPRSRIETSSFSTRVLAADKQLLAWRARVGHVVDVPPSNEQLAAGFGANIDRYAVDGMIFTDSRTEAMVLERSVARVS